VLLLLAVLFPIVPPPHLPPLCLLLGPEVLIFSLLCLQELLVLKAGESPPTPQAVKARVQSCSLAVLHVAHPLFSSAEPLMEGCPLCGLLIAEQGEVLVLLLLVLMLLLSLLCLVDLGVGECDPECAGMGADWNTAEGGGEMVGQSA
jgi:hypothetical protein